MLKEEIIKESYKSLDLKYFYIIQNNSGGKYLKNLKEGIAEILVIQAKDYKQANNILSNITAGYRYYCECCGERWSVFDYRDKGQNLNDVKNSVLNYLTDRFFSEYSCFVHYLDGKIEKWSVKDD